MSSGGGASLLFPLFLPTELVVMARDLVFGCLEHSNDERDQNYTDYQ